MPFGRYVLAGLVAFALSACTAAPRESILIDDFVSHIAEDGTKFFAYKVRLPQSFIEREQKFLARQQPIAQQQGQLSGPRREQRHERMLILVAESLERFFLTNGYCRYGYFELDKFVYTTSAEIRGECNETATSIDKKRFPNNQELPNYSGS